MKILYRQRTKTDGMLSSLGVENCYLKYLYAQQDSGLITRKNHHHTDYELHLMENGEMLYEIQSRQISLKAGEFLLLPPKLPHRMIWCNPQSSNFAVTFRLSEDSQLSALTNFLSGEIPEEDRQMLKMCLEEYLRRPPLHREMIQCGICRLLLCLWRQWGTFTPKTEWESSEDFRVAMAKQYISDNIEQNLSVSDVAAYCHLSNRQLNRLFLADMNTRPSAYICAQRLLLAQKLLLDSQLSLREISEQMNFSSEYYFNTFFRKHAGIPPGKYREMHQVK